MRHVGEFSICLTSVEHPVFVAKSHNAGFNSKGVAYIFVGQYHLISIGFEMTLTWYQIL